MVFILGALLYKAEESIHNESQARDILACVNYLYILKRKAEDSADYFVGTARPELPKKVHEAVSAIRSEQENLRSLTRSSPEFARSADALISCLDKNVQIWSDMVRLRSSANRRDWDTAGRMRHSTLRDTNTQELVKAFFSFQDKTSALLKKNSAKNLSAQSNIMLLILVGVVFNVVLAILLALAFARGITSRLGVIVDNSKLLSVEKKLNPPLGHTDEIGDLDRVFHDMASTLQEALRRDRALTENAMDVIFTIQDSRITKVNHAVNDSWGYSQEELIGKLPEQLFAENKQEIVRELETCRSTIELEAAIQRKDGRLVDTLWVAQWSEHEQCLFCVAHDITERKKEEQLLASREMRLRTVLDTMLVGLIRTTDDGIIEAANPKVCEIVQYKNEELQGQHLSSIFPQLTTNVLRDLAADNLSVDGAESTQAIKTIEIEALTQSSSALPVEISAGRLQISDKHIYLLTITDISARKELQLAKQEFIGMISEDLATPLSSVHDFLKVLTADTNLTQNGHDRAVLAVNNVGRLLRLLDDLFEINELESGQLELKPSMVSIQEIVDRAIDAVRVFAEKHKVTLESNQASSEIFADGDRLERVLVNLLSNAIKFSPEGAMVSVSITESEHSLQIKVVDHGRGIPASHLSSVFTAFKQVTSSDATKKGGTGLGLAICKAVIEQHGGSIGVDSVEGEGSTFWFELPLEPPVSETATT